MPHHHHTDEHHDHHCSEHGKHRHLRSPKRHGPQGRGRGRHGHGGPHIGKMLADGELRLIVLALLAEKPRHGYDIIKALEEHTSGFYTPSPGIVYPTLTFLEEGGLADATSKGNKKVFTITEDGRAHLEENRQQVDATLSEIEKIGQKMAADRERSDSPDRDIPGVVPEVNEARRALKSAMMEKLGASVDEQRRMASILREAAAAIRQQQPSQSPEDEIDLG